MAILAAAMLLVSAAIEPDPDAVREAALEAGVDETALLGALLTVSQHDPRVYLRHSGELPWPAPPPLNPSLERLVECVIWRESRGVPTAVNRSSGASGLGQFLRSTWATTPQGKAGLSVFDPVANRNAVRWMIQVGRGREFVTIGGC